MRGDLMILVGIVVVACMLSQEFARAATPPREGVAVVETLGPEEPAVQAARHGAVSDRRRGPAVLVHRGASRFALEESIEACVEALELGADGCEIDLRRARDGNIVLVHDPSVERVFVGVGNVSEFSLAELRQLAPRSACGHHARGSIATFGELLDTARQTAMLLHLDLKEPGLEADVARMLTEANMWDHVVSINDDNASSLKIAAAFQPLRYKASGLYLENLDLDPGKTAMALRLPGDMILVDDPRCAAHALGRPKWKAIRFQRQFKVLVRPSLGRGQLSGPPMLAAWTREWDRTRTLPESQLLKALKSLAEPRGGGNPREASTLSSSEEAEARIVRRAATVLALAQRGRNSARVVDAILEVALHPLHHTDFGIDQADGLLASEALGDLAATRAASRLTKALNDSKADAANRKADDVEAWRKWRLEAAWIGALGRLDTSAGRKWLRSAAGNPVCIQPGPKGQPEAIAVALAGMDVPWTDLMPFLAQGRDLAPGLALFHTLDHPNETRRKAVAATAAWAAGLPSSQCPEDSALGIPRQFKEKARRNNGGLSRKK